MKIIHKLDNIFTGRGQDQTAADSFNNSVVDQSNELEDLTADLNSVTRPPYLMLIYLPVLWLIQVL